MSSAASGPRRFVRFNAVGALGIGVQLATVAALVHGLRTDAVSATAAGVTAAVLHNFAWHVRWTWRDRMRPGVSIVRAFARFVTANGAVSFVGSVAMMPVLTGAMGLAPVTANLVTIVVCGLMNYWLAQHYCFRAEATPRAKFELRTSNFEVFPKSPAPAAPGRRPSAPRA